MTYVLYSEDGWVDLVASISGYDNLIQFVEAKGGTAVKAFVRKGETQNINGVLKDIDALLPQARDKDVRTTLRGLKRGLSKIKGKEIAIISES